MSTFCGQLRQNGFGVPCRTLGPVLLALGLCVGEMIAATPSAPLPHRVTPSSLRAAILDLQASFGDRYPMAGNYLKRLAQIEAGLAEPPDKARNSQEALQELARVALLANPLIAGNDILFVTRHQYRPDHHNTATFFPAARHEYNDGRFTPGGALKALTVGVAAPPRTLISLPQGLVRDPEVSFDGQRIVCSLRTNEADSYHICELKADGSGLRALTRAAEVDDLDPLCLPDGSIVFSSTREPKYCMCNRHIMANLFRMESDGSGLHQVGKSTLFEGHAAMMPDGRILFDRWEYVDRNFGDAQSLWTMNPDGTGHAVYWGNNTASPGAVLDGRPIPGTDQVLCVFGSCHDRPWGALAIIDRRRALDGREGVVRTWPPEAADLVRQNGWQLFDTFSQIKLKYEDPWPLSDRHFLCSRMVGQGELMGIFLVDIFGNEISLHVEPPGCFDPMPLAPRPVPSTLPVRRDFASPHGTVYVADVYRGTHMRGVKRGDIKWLRVVESPEKRFWTRPVWGGQGIEGPAMNWHDFNNKRILGTVPVREDGSASFLLPAERFVYFQLLDAGGMMVQSMRSGTLVQPAEISACVGCHEDRRTAPPVTFPTTSRSPDVLRGWHGPPRLFSYLAEVQPVFDRHCVRCHDFGGEGAKAVLLARDRDLVFNASYNELWRKKLVRVVGAGPPETQLPRSWGSHASRLFQVLNQGHHDVRLTTEERDRLATWIDLNAPYYPSYASAYPDNLAGRCPLDDVQLRRLEKLTGLPLRELAAHDRNLGPQVSFDRPEQSPCLAAIPAANAPARMEALGIISSGAAQLARRPEADTEGFEPCPTDQWRDQKYLARQRQEQRHREAIRRGQKSYDPAVLD